MSNVLSSPERGGGSRTLTEGQPQATLLLGCPSTMLRMVPLPVPGRI